jgi:hypothetical protein
MNPLLELIKAHNGVTRAWLAGGEDRFATTLPEELSFWTERGVFTVEDFIRYSLVNSIWDLFKDVHGVRPRWMNLSEKPLDELEKILEDLQFEAAFAFIDEGDIDIDDAYETAQLEQEKWNNPDDELFWSTGCWHDPSLHYYTPV